MKVALIAAAPLIALFDTTDHVPAWYERLLADADVQYRLYTTWPCLVEASHLLGSLARLKLLKWVGLGAVHVYPLDQTALLGMTQWMHSDTEPPRFEMDLADASLYWVAAETGVVSVLTVDVKDFSRYRLPDGRAFELL